MLKKDLFKKAMAAELYKDLAWIILAFSVSSDPDDEWKKDPYDCRIVSNVTGHYVVNNGVLEPIEETTANKPAFCFTDVVELHPGDLPNCKETIESTYGNWLVNYILIVRPFGDKIPYMDGDITPDRIEDVILTKFKDTPKNSIERKQNEFYVDEYLKYLEGIFFLPGLSQLSVWAATEKLLLPPPGIEELKAKLVEENKDHLDDMATIAKIDAELVKHDVAWLKGDPGMNFLGKGKAIDVVRKKKFLMHGGEIGLSDNTVKGTLIKNSLQERWDITKFPEVIDTLRAGSFYRGAETQLGGVSVKWLLRSSSNFKVTIDDCGATIGSPFAVTDKNKKRLVGFTVIVDKAQKHIEDIDEAGAYIGKTLAIRSPMYCKLLYTDLCKTCVGDNLSVNPQGLSLAISALGSAILQMSMSAMHAKQLSTAKMDFKKHLF